MSIRVGDVVFVGSGNPALVKDRDHITGQLRLEPGKAKTHDEMRHGYINGLSQDTRQSFNEILDEVKQGTEDPGERAEQLRLKIDELEQDPRNFLLARYLRAEMVHIMNTFNIKPKEYIVHESKAR